MLLHLQGGIDNVAADVVYHRSCYQVFTNTKTFYRLLDSPDEQVTAFDAASKFLLADITQSLLDGEKVYSMPDLRLVSLLEKEGVANPGYGTES